MTLIEIIFAAGLFAAGAAIVTGVGLLSAPAAWISGGVLGAGWLWLILTEVDE